MTRRFIKYFIIFFVVIFAVLNSRLVSAEFKFWLTKQGVATGVVLDKTPTPLPLLPVVATPKHYDLTIPAIGAKAPIVLEQSINPDVIFSRLEDGVVHYAGTPLPGEVGTSIILAHSSAYPWYKGHYGSVFALLTKLKPGDEVFVSDGTKILKYQVTESLVFNPFTSNDPKLLALSQSDRSSIVLVSCWPVGTAYKRIAVKADLVK